jgi:hypothetical protein
MGEIGMILNVKQDAQNRIRYLLLRIACYQDYVEYFRRLKHSISEPYKSQKLAETYEGV